MCNKKNYGLVCAFYDVWAEKWKQFDLIAMCASISKHLLLTAHCSGCICARKEFKSGVHLIYDVFIFDILTATIARCNISFDD